MIAEALESYLGGMAEKERLRSRALRLRGKMGKAEAEQLRRDTARLRAIWR